MNELDRQLSALFVKRGVPDPFKRATTLALEGRFWNDVRLTAAVNALRQYQREPNSVNLTIFKGKVETLKNAISQTTSIPETLFLVFKKFVAAPDPRRDPISIGDMFDMQMLMNHLSQLSDMATTVVGAFNSSISGMARKITS
jgi:hypothetical protein